MLMRSDHETLEMIPLDDHPLGGSEACVEFLS